MAKNVALVLGGGGAAGQAWTIGVVAGLAEAGVDLTEAADLVIGTSSGATAAAQVCSGIPPAELLASILSQPAAVGRTAPAAGRACRWRRCSSGCGRSAPPPPRRPISAAPWALFGLESDAAFAPRQRPSGAPWSPPGCRAANGRTGRCS